MNQKNSNKSEAQNHDSALQSQLAYLRKTIPDFDERCRNFYRAWKHMMDQRMVARMGYVKMRFYKRAYNFFLPAAMPFTDADHVFGLVNAVILFRDFFGEFVPYLYGFEPQWLEHVEEVVFHEIGEIKIGDWTDDGAYDVCEKDRLEQEAFDEFMKLFPPDAQARHQRQFADVREHKTIAKLFDKQAFILGIGYLKSKGSTGSLYRKRGLTERDHYYCRKTGSKRAIDNTFAHLLDCYRDMTFMPFVVGIIEAMYAEDFTELDSLVKSCTPGEPPPGVKSFY